MHTKKTENLKRKSLQIRSFIRAVFFSPVTQPSTILSDHLISEPVQ